jgi:hypothetical protein
MPNPTTTQSTQDHVDWLFEHTRDSRDSQETATVPEILEPGWLQRERQHIEKDFLEQLQGPHVAAVYRRIAQRSDTLTDREYRLLATLTVEWGRDLKNCFPSRHTIHKRLGGRRRSLREWDKVLGSLVKKGWIKRLPLTRTEDGQLRKAETKGKYISAVGCQFCIPADEIVPGSAKWEGPRDWSHRIYAQRRKRS